LKVGVQSQGGGTSDPQATGGTRGAAEPSPAKPASRANRRKDHRQEVDSSAEILLVNVGSRLRGRILDLSVGGCRIRTDINFPVGIYTRVEAEFRIDGLPFRLGGVIQDFHDRKTVGIRFLDVSARKREQLLELIDELAEPGAAQKPDDPAPA
jgi:c-di-GMP-binding flagellar brake protein YcgR